MRINKSARRRSARAWARLIEAWEKSGQSAGEFAAAHGIAPRTLSWWKWRLASKSAGASPRLRLVPLRIEPSSTPPSSASDAVPAWELVTARGHVLRVHREMGAADLCAVLAALELEQVR